MTRLADIKARLAAATPGPWRYDGMHNEIARPTAEAEERYWLIVSECRSAPDQTRHPTDQFGHAFDANFDLIAHMREDMALLVAALEAALHQVGLPDSTPSNEAFLARKVADMIADEKPEAAARYVSDAEAWEAIA